VNVDRNSCPHCGQSAPVVNRGLYTYCTACGQPRAPFMASSVTLAGRPSKVGGTVAAVLGWIVLAVGSMVALAVGLLLQAIWPAGFAGWGIGGMIGLVSVAMGLALVWSGRTLRRSGKHAAESVRDQAIHALAAHRGGVLTAREVSSAIGVSIEEADAILTEMTKQGDDVSLDVDDEGNITYRFTRMVPAVRQRWPEAERARVDTTPAPTEAAAEDPSPPERRKARP
jgi:hypothetical protein